MIATGRIKRPSLRLIGRTERAVERDALPAIQTVSAMISCSLVGERLIMDPKDWDSAEMEAIGGVGSVLATTAVELLRR